MGGCACKRHCCRRARCGCRFPSYCRTQESSTLFHVLGLKCMACGSYNTREIRGELELASRWRCDVGCGQQMMAVGVGVLPHPHPMSRVRLQFGR